MEVDLIAMLLFLKTPSALLLPVLLISSAIAQPLTFFAGASYAFQNNPENGLSVEVIHLVHARAGLGIGRHISAGLQGQHIWFTNQNTAFQPAYIAGPFLRASTSNRERLQFWLEAGPGTGNFCTCETPVDRLPYRKEGLVYLSFGCGLDFRLWKQLYLSGSVSSHRILNIDSRTWSHTYGGIGLVFRLFKNTPQTE